LILLHGASFGNIYFNPLESFSFDPKMQLIVFHLQLPPQFIFWDFIPIRILNAEIIGDGLILSISPHFKFAMNSPH
jgi:hypothetical protein